MEIFWRDPLDLACTILRNWVLKPKYHGLTRIYLRSETEKHIGAETAAVWEYIGILRDGYVGKPPGKIDLEKNDPSQGAVAKKVGKDRSFVSAADVYNDLRAQQFDYYVSPSVSQRKLYL